MEKRLARSKLISPYTAVTYIACTVRICVLAFVAVAAWYMCVD